MSDDKQLEELAARARQRQKDAPGADWDRFSAGETDDDTAAALRRAESEREAPRGSYEAFRPLDKSFREKMAGQAREQLARGRSAAQAPRPLRFPGRGGTAPAKRGFVPYAAAASVLLALGAVFAILPGGDVAPIPGYSATLTGASVSRSGPQSGDVPMFRPGDRFELRLTPDTTVDGAVRVLVLLDDGATITELGTPPPDIAPGGAVRIAGTVDTSIYLPAGNATLYAVVGRGGALPANRALRSRLADRTEASGDGWRAWRLTTSYTP